MRLTCDSKFANYIDTKVAITVDIFCFRHFRRFWAPPNCCEEHRISFDTFHSRYMALWRVALPVKPTWQAKCKKKFQLLKKEGCLDIQLSFSDPSTFGANKNPDSNPGLPDFSWYKHTKTGKIHRMTTKYTKLSSTTPNGRKTYQKDKNTSIFPIQMPSKIHTNWYFGMPIFHPANLLKPLK
jgi:hypothetical protein